MGQAVRDESVDGDPDAQAGFLGLLRPAHSLPQHFMCTNSVDCSPTCLSNISKISIININKRLELLFLHQIE